jgi:hypothetical protein
MNVTRFQQLLTKAFAAAPRRRLHGANVRTLATPLPLAGPLDQALDSDEERELYAGTFEAWPGNVHELLDTHGLRAALVGFSFDGFGPVSWASGLDAIGTGRRTYLCF